MTPGNPKIATKNPKRATLCEVRHRLHRAVDNPDPAGCRPYVCLEVPVSGAACPAGRRCTVELLGLLVGVSGWVARSVGRMTTSWELSLSIEARGHDDSHVGVVPRHGGSSPHLNVRVGTVVVHCLDPRAVMSSAEAWAKARVEAESWMPAIRGPRQRPPASGYGAAYPAASVILDGRQRWQVSHTGPVMDVTVGPLLVRVHDLTALETHVRAWAQASAIAVRAFPGKAVPFARLVEHARYAEVRSLETARVQRQTTRPLGLRAPAPKSARELRGDAGRSRD